MKVLMFGWEFPPHISGGLGTACHGLTQALAALNVNILFVVPKAFGDEDQKAISLIDANHVTEKRQKNTVRKRDENQILHSVEYGSIARAEIPSALVPYMPVDRMTSQDALQDWRYEIERITTISTSCESSNTALNPNQNFSGGYGAQLLDEVSRYAVVAHSIALQHSFDVIHAHDWLTYPAGIVASRVSGRPLVIHVHATEYDRAGAHPDPRVLAIEREGLRKAKKIIAVSKWTKDILVKRYGIPKEKISVVHNGIADKNEGTPPLLPFGKRAVTFLGRITYQKGPQYFVEAAAKVLRRYPEIHFIMAGAGDLLPRMIEYSAQLRISSHFHFTGFLKEKRIQQIWGLSDLYVMPSVSEPFGITPLEALRAGVPVIISRQSGVAEVLPHAIKVDFWNVDALANAILKILRSKRSAMHHKRKGKEELKKLTWNQAARKIKIVYENAVR